MGFPLELSDVPLIKLRGEWTVDIDYTEMEEKMALAVPLKDARLTGNEIRFLRLHLGLTLSALAGHLGVTHQAVAKWEATGDKITNMGWSTEKDLRLFALARKQVGDRLFRKAYESLDRMLRGSRRHLGLPAQAISSARGQFLKTLLS